MTQCSIQPYPWTGARLHEENPLPIFRNQKSDTMVLTNDPFPPEKKDRLGWKTGFRVLPYRMQDHYTRRREPLSFQSVVLENEHLKAVFLPELGGRLVSLVSKPDGRELLSKNPIFQPANLAIRNAWFSGGIEWNIGQLGHTFSTCSPVFCAAICGVHGEPGVRIYEFERCKQVFWHIDFYLPPDSPYLIAYTRIINPRDDDISMYYWSNIAVPEMSGTRVLSATTNVIYIDFSQAEQRFGYGQMPILESTGGKDASYPTNFLFSNEYFFQCDGVAQPWEAAAAADGGGLVEFSTSRLAYRKMFCWGMHSGGRRWQNMLSLPGNEYIEIQAGLAPTQLHGLEMPAGAEWDWVQAFGLLRADAHIVHQNDFVRACNAVQQWLQREDTYRNLSRIASDCQRLSTQEPSRLFSRGSGWGALEAMRMQKCSGRSRPAGLLFPQSCMKKDEKMWLKLLEEQTFPEPDPLELPGEWMVQKEWLESLQQLPQKNWYSLLHEGVMQMESGNSQAAITLWQQSIEMKPSPWAYRNLANAAFTAQRWHLARTHYQKAWELVRAAGKIPASLVVEYLQCLIQVQRFDEAIAVYEALPDEVKEFDRIQILLARIALGLGDLDLVDATLRREFAVVQEGEVELTDIWFEMSMKRALAEDSVDKHILRKEIEERYPPPANIDFRLFA